MTRKDATTKKLIRLVQSLEKELSELEEAHSLQFDLKASLNDKLAASKRARNNLKEALHLRDLIEQSLVDLDK